jgi:chromosome segregation ATPase
MIPWEYVATIVAALGGLITVLSAALIKNRHSRASINLQEDAYLYKRLREQAAKQDNRITHLEQEVATLNVAYRESENHRSACEAKVELLENQVRVLQGFMRSNNPGLDDDDRGN